MPSLKKKPSVFAYLSYRLYLRDMYAFLKRESKGFSYRSFSQAAGFKSQSVLKQLIDGKRNLADESIGKVIKALGLRKRQAGYFRTLVHFEQTNDSSEKREHLEALLRYKSNSRWRTLTEKSYSIYKDWYLAAIRERVATEGFKEDVQWIAESMVPPIRPSQANKALRILQKNGFIRRDAHGQLQPTDSIIKTPPEVSSLVVRNFNRQMIARAQEALERVPAKKREISGMTISCSNQMFDRVKKRIQSFKDEILHMIETEQKPPHEVFQFNVQLFPLSDSSDGKEAV
jgi:uncharacterized protein (TIGR02147 family)